VVDVLQVPAFLARQTDLLVACGRTNCTINIKKGQFMAPQEMGNAVQKVRDAGNDRIWLTERGSFFGYNRLVMTSPPGGDEGVRLPRRVRRHPFGPSNPPAWATSPAATRNTPPPRRAAVAAVWTAFSSNATRPKAAKSDAATVMALDQVEPLLAQCKQLSELRTGWRT